MGLKRLAWILGLSWLSLTAHAEDLLDICRQAISHDPQLALAGATRRYTAEAVPLARSALLPQISGSYGISQDRATSSAGTVISGSTVINTGNGGVGHQRTLSAGVSASQSLLNLQDIASLWSAHASVNAQNALYQGSLQDLYVRVAQAYLKAIQYRSYDQAYQAYAEISQQVWQQVAARNAHGLASKIDVNQAMTSYGLARTEAVDYHNQYNDALEALRQITGSPVGRLLQLADPIPLQTAVPASEDYWIERASSNNPTVVADQFKLDAALRAILAARAAHLPTLSATISYNKNPTWTQFESQHSRTTDTAIGLSLSVPIFSGGAMHAQVRQAIASRDQGVDQLEIDRRQVVRDARNYYRSLAAGVEQVRMARDSAIAAAAAVKSARAGLLVAATDMTTVLYTIEYQAEANTEYAYARNQFLMNQLLLKQAAGDVTWQDLEALNRLLR
ncbi:outer membrane protein [Frateuria aurantia DSM 6220]|uniref:Outer membrane protein n=1 Tax=Frateuria aurantia (strain ATCC 33424 / DSM 6220 / KCTC 2777 / LMG 1558 / NBRC 3245 / NCIMB 13370) TaxID=767434 RepID=H8L4B5_FRAAD|nr:outer membrane protein [Frateuria aurantia DSM 6220]